MKLKQYHLVGKRKNWKLVKQKSKRTSLLFEGLTKEEAIKRTRRFAKGKKLSVRIHKTDGVIQQERTYPRSADPSKYKG